MLFNSLSYAIFLPAVFILYWVLPGRYRTVLLLLASLYFYMSWNPKYVVLILFTTAVSYFCAILLEKTSSGKKRKLILAAALILCLGVLFVFKYWNFTALAVSRLLSVSPRLLKFVLPVGISFYTFQTLGYVIDVYRDRMPAEKDFISFAAFVSFFPQLVAGPIERSENLLPQLKVSHVFDAENAFYGVRLILWGLFKKMLIADNLAVYVDAVYGRLTDFGGGAVLLATFFFAIQIYCDFSGYSDIARGSARLFGIELMENFRSPYLSTSIREFWSRWHISLSGWFRDYLYIPLGGNRVGRLRNCFNVMVTFLVSGLWHGADWNFLVWGGLHGAAQVFENVAGIRKREKKDLIYVLRMALVFMFTMLAWIFFRADSVQDGFYALRTVFSGCTHPKSYVLNGLRQLGIGRALLMKLMLYLVPLTVFDFMSLKTDVISLIGRQKAVLRHAAAIAVILLIMLFGYAGKSAFVYFQF